MAILGDVITEIGQVGLWLQAIGVVVLLVVIFQAISFFYNRKRLKEIHIIKQDMVRIEKKIDKIVDQTK